MTAPRVDVLAVMDARILREFARDTGPFRVNKGGATELAAALVAIREARAAVAELIEAGREYERISQDRLMHEYNKNKAFLRLSAALARVQP